MPSISHLRLALLACLFMLASFALAAQAQAPAVPSAELAVANRTIFVFRSPLAGYSPADRAEAAQRRLDRALARKGPGTTSIHAIPEGAQVLLDGSLLFLVTPGDVNLLAGDTSDTVAADSAARLSVALREKTEQASPRYLAIAAGLAFVTMLAWLLALRGIGLAQAWADRRLQVLLARRIERLSFRNVRLLDAEHYVGLVRRLAIAAAWALRLLATYLWLAFVLRQFPYSRAWGEWLQGHLVDTSAHIARGVAAAVPGLLIVLLIAALARVATLTVTSISRRIESGQLQLGGLDRDTAAPSRRLANLVIWLFALAMAYPYLPGSHTAAFQGVTVLAGLMVSIGASSIVAQGAAGLILMYTRPLRKGEYVKIAEAEGTVVDLGMFSTRLRTGLGEEVSMPNAYVLANTTKNLSRAFPGSGFVVDTTVTIGYDTPWRQVHAMLETAARNTEGILETPPPFVAQTALSDFYIEYRLVAYADVSAPRARAELLSHLHQGIVDEFNRQGVQIMSPHFTQEPKVAQMVRPADWHGPAPQESPVEAAGSLSEKATT
ncbi:mechanosensitive ion channel family protein [Pseudoduganella albidiflava]|uniref:Small-conductance mechanosensitive channel n=1 Tax=Pseudoduganella albidiflava TaxID=321983 RepID=A0AA87XY31_9BURK|nr:mechanosensitive ion channel family protein [Pseudoduganella albidiflava]GGY48985.1 mechanosensitive ion channel protein MscS [Pseudoduganella albidiflava]